jgi:hypothetical protein
MRKIYGSIVFALILSANLYSAELSTVSSQDLLAIYRQLRAIQPGDSVVTEDVVLKRDSSTFRFLRGRLTFSAPIAGRVLAARFQGEGSFELEPVSPFDKQQLSRFIGKLKLIDSFREAVFFFTDDTFAELSKLPKATSSPVPEKTAFVSYQKLYSENFNDWAENKRRGNPGMRNLAARILADLTDGTSRGFFLADFKGKEYGNLLFHISWNRDTILLPEYPKGEEVMLLHAKPGSYYQWWSGFHLSSEYAQSPHPDHRTLTATCPSARIDMQLKGNSLSAAVEMDFTVSDGIRILPFNLNGVLRISSITDGNGNPLAFIQENRELDSDPWVILPEPARGGRKYKMKIIYKEESTADSRIISARGSGLFYVRSRESWFPSFGSFDDRTQFELHARSPKKYKFVASGNLVESKEVKDEILTTWKSEAPFNVIGFNYGAFVEASQGSPDFSITAYAGRELPDQLKQLESDSSLLELAGMRRGINVPASPGILIAGLNIAQGAKYAAGMSLQAFKFYEFLFGKLPFKSVSVTEQPIRGYGQSWPNLIFLPYDSLMDATTRNSLGYQESAEEREFYNLVAIHEMAHQWWGHMVGCKTYHDEWLSEGIAEFATGLYLRQFQPKDVNDFWNQKRSWLLSKNAAGYRPIDAGPIWLSAQLGDFEESQNTRLIYHKGAYVLEMLRVLMYDASQKNPDGRFIAAMQDFVKTYAGKNASTEDFQAVVEKHCGESMDWFFHEWVYGTAVPSYDFTYELQDAGAGQTQLIMTISQYDVPDNFKMKLPVYLSVKGELIYLGTIPAEGARKNKIKTILAVHPDRVLLDPLHSILANVIRQR